MATCAREKKDPPDITSSQEGSNILLVLKRLWLDADYRHHPTPFQTVLFINDKIVLENNESSWWIKGPSGVFVTRHGADSGARGSALLLAGLGLKLGWSLFG